MLKDFLKKFVKLFFSFYFIFKNKNFISSCRNIELPESFIYFLLLFWHCVFFFFGNMQIAVCYWLLNQFWLLNCSPRFISSANIPSMRVSRTEKLQKRDSLVITWELCFSEWQRNFIWAYFNLDLNFKMFKNKFQTFTVTYVANSKNFFLAFAILIGKNRSMF